MKKKTLSLALALAMCLGLSIPALAADSDFTIENGELIEYHGPGGAVTIPDGVTQIGLGVFNGCENLTSVTIPDGVTDISQGAFSSCANLISVTIPVSVTTIWMGAFGFSTNLKDVYYAGSQEQWESIKIWFSNDPLENATIHYNSVNTAPSEKPTTPSAEIKTADPTNDKLEVNGAAQDPTVYKIGGSNYFKIRDVAAVLNGTEKQFAVGYSGGKVTVTSGQPYEATGKELAGAPDSSKEASPSNDAIVIDGVETSLTVYKIGGSNYFKLRDLGEALNFYVGWEAGRGVYIETDKPYSK